MVLGRKRENACYIIIKDKIENSPPEQKKEPNSLMSRFQLVVGKFNRKKKKKKNSELSFFFLRIKKKFYKHRDYMKTITYKGRVLGWQYFF